MMYLLLIFIAFGILAQRAILEDLKERGKYYDR